MHDGFTPPVSSVPWKSGVVDLNGVRIAYDVAGEGEPMLLVMGLATQCILWPPDLCQALIDAGYQLIRFDNRDIGLSGSVDRGVPVNIARDFLWSRVGGKVISNYTLHDMTEDAVGLLDALGIARAHVVGISMGGIIAQLLAAKHPKRVHSLALLMSHTNHPFYGAPHPRVLVSSGPPAQDETRAQCIERNVRAFKVLGSPAYRRSDDELRYAFGVAYDRDHRPDGMARQTHALFATGCIDNLLSTIRVPTHVVHGLADLLVLPINAKRIAKRIAGAKLTLFPGMGHDFPPALLPQWARIIIENALRRTELATSP